MTPELERFFDTQDTIRAKLATLVEAFEAWSAQAHTPEEIASFLQASEQMQRTIAAARDDYLRGLALAVHSN